MNEAFRQLPRILDGIEHLDMRFFGITNECGTIMCLAGACYFDHWMRENTTVDELFDLDDSANRVFSKTPYAQDLADFFDISNMTSRHIFFEADRWTTKEMVRVNIDRVLNGQKTVSYREMMK